MINVVLYYEYSGGLHSIALSPEGSTDPVSPHELATALAALSPMLVPYNAIPEVLG